MRCGLRLVQGRGRTGLLVGLDVCLRNTCPSLASWSTDRVGGFDRFDGFLLRIVCGVVKDVELKKSSFTKSISRAGDRVRF